MRTIFKNAHIYVGKAIFIVVIAALTLLAIDYIGMLLEPAPIEYATITTTKTLESEPTDVLFAQTYETEVGPEVKYAYMTETVPAADGEDVTRRTPESQTRVIDVQVEGSKKVETLQTFFYSKPQFYEDGGAWKQIEYATTTPETFAASGAIKYVQKREWWEKILPGKPLFAQTSTFYPNPNVESTSVDGEVSYSNFTSSGSANDSATSIDIRSQSQYEGIDCFCYLISYDRAILLFDTSSLPDSAVVTDATLSVYVTSRTVSDNDGDDVLNVRSSNPASNTALVAADYNTVGGTNYASSPPDISSMSTGAYTNITLNTSGKNAITATGITKYGLREGHDSSPTLADGTLNRVTISSAEVSGTSQDPKLEVTYTTASFSFGQWFPF